MTIGDSFNGTRLFPFQVSPAYNPLNLLVLTACVRLFKDEQ